MPEGYASGFCHDKGCAMYGVEQNGNTPCTSCGKPVASGPPEFVNA